MPPSEAPWKGPRYLRGVSPWRLEGSCSRGSVESFPPHPSSISARPLWLHPASPPRRCPPARKGSSGQTGPQGPSPRSSLPHDWRSSPESAPPRPWHPGNKPFLFPGSPQRLSSAFLRIRCSGQQHRPLSCEECLVK